MVYFPKFFSGFHLLMSNFVSAMRGRSFAAGIFFTLCHDQSSCPDILLSREAAAMPLSRLDDHPAEERVFVPSTPFCPDRIVWFPFVRHTLADIVS